jgi:hypothetical protein
LILKRTGIGDATLERIGPIESLETLDVSGTRITDRGMLALGNKPALRELRINRTAVTDRGVAIVRDFAALEDLELIGVSAITTRGLSFLPELTRSRTLPLFGLDMDDGILPLVARLPRLRFLALQGTQITSRGLQALPPAPELSELRLSNTDVSDAAIPYLAQMTGLRRVDLLNTRVTGAGVARLRDALPNCWVVDQSAFPGGAPSSGVIPGAESRVRMRVGAKRRRLGMRTLSFPD